MRRQGDSVDPLHWSKLSGERIRYIWYTLELQRTYDILDHS